MNFELQHSTTPQPKLLDEDPVSAKPWPMPASRPVDHQSVVSNILERTAAWWRSQL